MNQSYSMRSLLSSLLLTLLAACHAPLRGDSVSIGGPRELAATNAYLAGTFHPAKPVVLEGVQNQLEQGRYGQTLNLPDEYLVRLDSRVDPDMQKAVLIHEWAHILVWERGLQADPPHGEDWGRMFSVVFMVWAGEESP